MNLLIVNQSVIDMCASFVMLLTAAVTVDGTRMSRDRVSVQVPVTQGCHVTVSMISSFVVYGSHVFHSGLYWLRQPTEWS